MLMVDGSSGSAASAAAPAPADRPGRALCGQEAHALGTGRMLRGHSTEECHTLLDLPPRLTTNIYGFINYNNDFSF